MCLYAHFSADSYSDSGDRKKNLQMSQALQQATDKLINWLKYDAIPLWTQSGIDSRNGSCFESLKPSGAPDIHSHRRMKTQGKQMYVFARAESIGWARGLQGLVKRICVFASMEGTLPNRSDGYVSELDHEFNITNSDYSVYDHAFFILSSMAAYAAYGNGSELRRACNIIEWLDLKFKHAHGGWLDGSYPSTEWRQQRTQMAMFEAFVFLFEVTRKESWLNRAREVFQLFSEKLYRPEHRAVFENYSQDLTAFEPVLEPGKLMNWLWLLRRFEDCTGESTGSVPADLLATALRLGRDGDTGLIFKRVNLSGNAVDSRRDCDSLASLIKASLREAQVGNEEAAKLAVWGINALFKYFVSEDVRGLFYDSVEGQDALKCGATSAVNLYHLLNAGVEAERYQKFLLRPDLIS